LRTLPRRAANASAAVALQPVRVGWRRLVVRLGSDVTNLVTAQPCAVVATYPGDEALACGATIARLRAKGTPVQVIFVTDGPHLHHSRYLRARELVALRRDEATSACAMIGVTAESLHFLGFEAETLERCTDDLATALAKLLGRIEAEHLLVPSVLDRESDRRAVHRATLRAAARIGSGAHMAAYPVSLWADGPIGHLPAFDGNEPSSALPSSNQSGELLQPLRAEVTSSEGYLFLKRAAWERYRSLTTNLTAEIDWPQMSVVYADSFMGPAEVRFPVMPSTAQAELAAADPASESGQGTDRARPADIAAPIHTPMVDRFLDDRLAGEVVGSTTLNRVPRLGVDSEGSIAIDGGRLRLGHLRSPGWQRQAVAYGPFLRRAGLTLTVRALNSHHNAHHWPGRETSRRVLLSRVARDLSQNQRLPEDLDDNLVIGFHSSASPTDPRRAGHSFVMHAAGVVNGELRTSSAEGVVQVHEGVQELPFDYVVVLRERGAVYYVASLPGAAGAGAPRHLRPVAVDARGDDATLFAGVHQSVHGETGHEISSRVDDVRVCEVPAFRQWYTSALEADALIGDDLLDHSTAELGGRWLVSEGMVSRTAAGATAAETGGAALVGLAEPAGLVSVVIRTAPVPCNEGYAGLLWRADSAGTYGWRVRLFHDRAELAMCSNGVWTIVAECPAHLAAAAESSLQVLDDGRTMAVHLDGQLLFGRKFTDERHAAQRAVGLVCGPGSRCQLAWFEAHPRSVPAPAELDLPSLWCEQGTQVVAADDFLGEAGELAASLRPGAPAWQRTVGPGFLDLTGDGSLRVRANRLTPNRGRTLYTFDWSHPDLADLEVTIEPPGSARSQGHGSRAGLTFGEDSDTYLVANVWLDDSPQHDGSAVSLFYCHRGCEEQLKAVWTNVGRRICWGAPSRLRAACDGQHIVVWLDDEPVLFRRTDDLYPGTRPFSVRRVGLVVNREWGDDTGSTFTSFVARSRP
jgi:LmbE family N-acetylglucosaminyl deacetylase